MILHGARTIHEGLEQGNVFVHCHLGVSRSSTLIIAYFILYLGWGFQETIEFLKDIRPQVSPEKKFVKHLKLLKSFK